MTIKTPSWKADAWSTAAGHLEAIAQDKLSEELSDEERRVWKHVMGTVVRMLDRKAQMTRQYAAKYARETKA